jgi:ABC-type Fe3+/spermidine/putrescine transport system ATPase subunit
VASFIGKSNILNVTSISKAGAGCEVHIAGSGLRLRVANASPQARFCCIRPEDLVLLAGSDTPFGSCVNRLKGTLRRVTNLGACLELSVEVDPSLVLSVLLRSSLARSLPSIDGEVEMGIDPGAIRMLVH